MRLSVAAYTGVMNGVYAVALSSIAAASWYSLPVLRRE